MQQQIQLTLLVYHDEVNIYCVCSRNPCCCWYISADSPNDKTSWWSSLYAVCLTLLSTYFTLGHWYTYLQIFPRQLQIQVTLPVYHDKVNIYCACSRNPCCCWYISADSPNDSLLISTLYAVGRTVAYIGSLVYLSLITSSATTNSTDTTTMRWISTASVPETHAVVGTSVQNLWLISSLINHYVCCVWNCT